MADHAPRGAVNTARRRLDRVGLEGERARRFVVREAEPVDGSDRLAAGSVAWITAATRDGNKAAQRSS
jgi:hypothetical protein